MLVSSTCTPWTCLTWAWMSSDSANPSVSVLDDGSPSGRPIAEDDAQLVSQVGVGPWPGGPSCWPDDERLDPKLLAEGDRRNVLDCYRYWRMDAIVSDLDGRRRGFHVAIENLGHDFNIGSIVRTANAMGASTVHIVGRKRWNRRGAMVTDRYMHVFHHPTLEDFTQWCRQAAVVPVGIDIVPGAKPIEETSLPASAMLVFGAESQGLSDGMRDFCRQIVYITQYGSTRSMNVGHAAAIAMFAWNQRKDAGLLQG